MSLGEGRASRVESKQGVTAREGNALCEEQWKRLHGVKLLRRPQRVEEFPALSMHRPDVVHRLHSRPTPQASTETVAPVVAPRHCELAKCGRNHTAAPVFANVLS